jgi:hypothetical protein
MNIVIYKIASGEIRCSATCVEEMLGLQYNPETENYLEHSLVDDSMFYVVSDQIVPRPTFTETVSGTVITGLPNPTTVVVNGTTTVVTDGEANLAFKQTGTYFVQLYSFPYVEKTIEVTQT